MKGGIVARILVVLEQVEILDDHDPGLFGPGEIAFTSRVTPNGNRERTRTRRFPAQGTFRLSAGVFPVHQTIFDGEFSSQGLLEISLQAVEFDSPGEGASLLSGASHLLAPVILPGLSHLALPPRPSENLSPGSSEAPPARQEFTRYRRIFAGPFHAWAGSYRPEEVSPGSESLIDWKVWYRIEVKDSQVRDREADESLPSRRRRLAWGEALRRSPTGALPEDAWRNGIQAREALRAANRVTDGDPGGPAPVGAFLGARMLGTDGAKVSPAGDPLPGASAGSANRFIRVEGPRHLTDTTLSLSLDAALVSHLNPLSLRVFRFDESLRKLLLVERSGLGREGSYVWAQLTQPGVYGVYGLPRDVAGLLTSQLRCLLRKAGPLWEVASVKGSAVMNQLCQLIYCDPSIQATGILKDPARLDTIGLPDAVGDPFLFHGSDLLDLPRDDKGRPQGSPSEYRSRPSSPLPGDPGILGSPPVSGGTPPPPGWRQPSGNVCDTCLKVEVPDLIFPIRWDPPECQILEVPGGVRRAGGFTLATPPTQERWRSVGPTNVAGRMTCLAFHPSIPSILYAAAGEGGVWRSTDLARTWEPMSDQEDSLAIGAIAVAPGDPTTIYAGTGEYQPGGTVGVSVYLGIGVLRSTNEGRSWTLMSPVRSRRFSRIVVHPKESTRVYVAGDGGVERWDEPRQQWITLSTTDTSDLALDPSNPKRLYVAQEGGAAIQVTDDAEVDNPTWSAMDAGITLPAATRFTRLAVSASNSKIIYALINADKLDDQGNTVHAGGAVYRWNGSRWVSRGIPVDNTYQDWCSTIAVHPQDPEKVIAAGVHLWWSEDGGRTWAQRKEGHADVHHAMFHPLNPNLSLIANDGGVWIHDDGVAADPQATAEEKAAAEDYRSANGGLVTTQFFNVGVSHRWPDKEPFINLGNPSPQSIGGSTQDQGILKSDGSTGFIGLGGNEGGIFEIDPNDGNVLYWDPWNGDLRRTDDGTGSGRRDASDGIPLAAGGERKEGVTALAIHPDDSRILICATYGNRVLYSDTAASPGPSSSPAWREIVANTGGVMRRISFAPSDTSRVYGCVDDGTVWRSDDGGKNWNQVSDASLPAGSLRGLAVDWNDRDTLFVTYGGTGTFFGHVWRSEDGGVTWTDISGTAGTPTGRPGAVLTPQLRLPDLPVVSIVQHYGRPETLYAASEIGVFRTTTGGASWAPFDEDLPNAVVSDMDYRVRTGELFVSTIGRGMWVRKV